MLKEMLSMQKRFGQKFVNFDQLTSKGKIKWTKEFIICMMDEMSEVLNWMPWKRMLQDVM